MYKRKVQTSIYLQEELLKAIDELVEAGKFISRSEAIRFILASFLEKASLTLMKNGQYYSSYYCRECSKWLPKALFAEALYCPYCGHRLRSRDKKPYIIEL